MKPQSTRRANGEGSVHFDESRQRWAATITGPDGKRHKRTAATKKEANQRLHELQDEQRLHGRIASPQATLKDLMDAWKTKALDASRPAPSTKVTKLWAYSRLQRELGDVRLINLTPDRIEQALCSMAQDGLSRESLIKVRSVLNQICKFGERRDLLRKNPVTVVQLPSDLRDSDDGRALNTEQARQLLEASHSDRLHPLWTTMMMLGLRPGEALGLHWSDIDFAHDTLHVRQALRQGTDGLEITEHLKTRQSRRRLAMPEPVLEALAQHRITQSEECEHAAEAWSYDWPDLVFTTLVGTPIHPSNLRREFAILTERAGLGRWTPNELRHTAVSLLSELGVPLERIADVVGHDGTRMTAKVYRHTLTPSIEHAVGPMRENAADA